MALYCANEQWFRECWLDGVRKYLGTREEPTQTVMEKKKENTNMRYEFQSVNEADIDFNKIFDDLSAKSPMALISFNNKQKYVVLYPLLLRKAAACGMEKDAPYHIDKPTGSVIMWLPETETFSDWVEWARAVRKAPWPERNKATITVAFPSV